MFNSRKECLDYLISVGMLKRFNELNLYHGRAKNEGDFSDWQVQSDFDNSGNNTGHRNVNGVSTLYLAERNIAIDFATSRAREMGGRPDIYKILSIDNDALIFDRSFSINNLPDDVRNEVLSALKELVMHASVTEYSPMKFEHREQYGDIVKGLQNYSKEIGIAYFAPVDIRNVVKELNVKGATISEDAVEHLAESFNARTLLANNPYYAVRAFIHDEPIVDNRNTYKFKIDLEWVASWLSANKIIGERKAVNSATLKRDVDTVAVFDKEKINTTSAIIQKKEKLESDFGSLRDLLGNFSTNEKLIDVLSKTSAKNTMNYMYQNSSFKDLMEKDAGVWEKFSVGEHTETVLRVFDESFKYDILPELVPFIKILILSHDMGKGVAVENKQSQEMCTRNLCLDFYQGLGITREVAQLMEFLILDSQKYTNDYYIKGDITARERLINETSKKLKSLFGIESPSGELIKGIMSIAKIIQTCDGGAYTRYGVTRDKGNNVYYKNGNDRFTKSFHEPKGFRSNKQILKLPEGVTDIDNIDAFFKGELAD